MEISAYEQRKSALIEEITAAFDGVSRENGVSLTEAWVIDNYGSMEERNDARKQDTEMRWQDVPDEQISSGDSCLSFMDEIGFHYYIPAYMVWYLHYMDAPDHESYGSGNTFDSLEHHLCLNNDLSLRKRSLANFSRFTVEQSKAVSHFLQFIDEMGRKGELELAQIILEQMITAERPVTEIEEKKLEIEKLRAENGIKETVLSYAIKEYWGKFL